MSRNRNKYLKGKWALITGASRGIGKQYALTLADYGLNLFLISNESCDEVITQIQNKVLVRSLCINLAENSSVQEIINKTQDIEIEVLINNAGVFFFDSMLDVDMDKIETMLSLHVVTSTRLCRVFGRQMKERGHGYILNMGSASDILPYPGISTYAATKAYIKNMSIALNQELRLFGVHVMGVRPGAVATGLYGVTGKIQKIGLKLGIIITPEKLVRRAVKKLFSSRCAIYVPRLSTYSYVLFSRVPWPLMKLFIKYSPLYKFLK